MCPQNHGSRFLPVLFVSLLGLTLCAGAQIQPPPGWTVQAIPNAVLLDSPAGWNSPDVVLTLLAPSPVAGPAESWFTSQTVARSQAAGLPLAATNIMRRGQLLIRVVEIQTQGQTMRAVFYAYPAAGQQQLVVLIIPEMVADSDPRLDTANSYVQELAARRIDLGPVIAPYSTYPQSAYPAIGASPSPQAELQRHYDQARSLQRFQNNMTDLTIDQMRAMSH